MQYRLVLALLMVTIASAGQTKRMIGKVLSADLETLPSVQIMDKDTAKLGTGDLKGLFDISVPTNCDLLIIAFIGYEWQTIKLSTDCDTVEIILLPAVLYHHISHRKIDRLREKEFKKIPEIHKSAFSRGLFTKSQPCYSSEFVPIKRELDQIGKKVDKQLRKARDGFNRIQVGDTVRIPFSGHDGTTYSAVVEDGDFDCIVEGVVAAKGRRYHLKIGMTRHYTHGHLPMVINGKEIGPGSVLEFDADITKILFPNQ